MNIGDIFNTKGYDVVATMKRATEGEVVVLNNNSTHYLVAVRRSSDDDDAMLVVSIGYGIATPALPSGTKFRRTPFKALLLALSWAIDEVERAGADDAMLDTL